MNAMQTKQRNMEFSLIKPVNSRRRRRFKELVFQNIRGYKHITLY
jgi:hypothetical protein